MDGALSNNLPLFELRNTITVAPFSGESDICPQEGTLDALQVHYGNVSVKVTTRNVHRICTSFLPPRLEVSPSRSFVSQNGGMYTSTVLCWLSFGCIQTVTVVCCRAPVLLHSLHHSTVGDVML